MILRLLTSLRCFYEQAKFAHPKEAFLDPILAKIEQLRSVGWQVPDGEQAIMPLLDGGSMVALPNYSAAIFWSPGSNEGFVVQGNILRIYS